MKVLVLGTSNSILRTGWVRGLRHGLPNAEIVNKSIGASPGIQFACLSGEDITSYDYVLFDSIPNDEEYYNWNLSKEPNDSKEVFFRALESIWDNIRAQSQLIFVNIPIKSNFYTKSEVLSHRISYAERESVPFVDTALIINFVLEKFLIKFDDIYKYHPAHPEVSIMNLIGRQLASILMTYRCPSIEKHLPEGSIFKKVIINDSDKGRLYKNSIINEQFSVVEEGYLVKLDDSCIFLGMYINIRNCNCVISFRDKIDREIYSISLYYDYALDENSIVKVFIPCPQVIRPDHFIVYGSYESRCDYFGMGSCEEPIDTAYHKLTVSDIILFDKNEYIFEEKRNTPWIDLNRHLIDAINAISRYSFYITGRHGNDSLPKNLSYFEKNIKSKQKSYALMTHAETILCFDLNNYRLSHHTIERIQEDDDIYIVSPEFYGVDKISICVHIGRDRVYNLTGDDSLMNVHFQGILMCLTANNKYLSAHPNGDVSLDRDEASTWERFELCCIL